jgi:dipeptidyl aminopeptidase/acylaminoacyl peptidase
VINLWRGENGAVAPITSGNQRDTDAAFAHDGTLAFISAQPDDWLYLQAPGQAPRRFVELTGQAPRGLRWSPDGRRLVYAARVENRYRLFVVDAASGLIQQVPGTGDANLLSPSWAADGRSLVCASRDERGWRLLRVDLTEDESSQAISEYGWFEGIETDDGLFAANRRGVWRLAPGRAPELVLSVLWPIERTHPTWNWTVVAGRIYAVDRTPGRTRVLSRSAAGGPVTRSLDVEAFYGGSLAVDPSTGAIVFGVVVDEQVDIGLIRFQPR